MCSAHLSQQVRQQINPDGYRDTEKFLEMLRAAFPKRSKVAAWLLKFFKWFSD
jgi:hypothetical protein